MPLLWNRNQQPLLHQELQEGRAYPPLTQKELLEAEAQMVAYFRRNRRRPSRLGSQSSQKQSHLPAVLRKYASRSSTRTG